MKYILLLFTLAIFSISHSQEVDIQELRKMFDDREFEKIISILSKKEAEQTLVMDEFIMLAKSYGRLGQFGNGLAYANRLISICEGNRDTTNLVRAYNLKAENLLDLNHIKEGIEFCETVAPIFREQDSLQYQALCFKWGILYKQNGEKQKAYDTYSKITAKKYRNLSLFNNNYAVILETLGRYDEAIVYYKKGLDYKREKNISLGVEFANIANILMKQNHWDDAKKYLDSAENAITKKTSLRTQKIIYNQYYEYYQLKGNLLYASDYLDLVNETNEEIFNKKLEEEIQELKTAYNRETQLNNKLAKSKKERLWGAIIFLFIIIVLLSLLYLFKYRNIKAAHETVMIEQRLLRSQMTPHFIFNSLSVLQGMVLNKENKKAVSYLSKFSKLLRLMLENSRDKLVPLEEELEAIQNYVDLHKMRGNSSFRYTVSIEDSLKNLHLLIPPMLIQPFVENAIAHGFTKDFKNAEISLDLSFTDKQLNCIIKDNGVGLNASKNKKTNRTKKSLSTKITTERLKIFAKEYKVTTGLSMQDRKLFNEQGTQINLILPYKIEQDA